MKRFACALMVLLLLTGTLSETRKNGYALDELPPVSLICDGSEAAKADRMAEGEYAFYSVSADSDVKIRLHAGTEDIGIVTVTAVVTDGSCAEQRVLFKDRLPSAGDHYIDLPIGAASETTWWIRVTCEDAEMEHKLAVSVYKPQKKTEKTAYMEDLELFTLCCAEEDGYRTEEAGKKLKKVDTRVTILGGFSDYYFVSLDSREGSVTGYVRADSRLFDFDAESVERAYWLSEKKSGILNADVRDSESAFLLRDHDHNGLLFYCAGSGWTTKSYTIRICFLNAEETNRFLSGEDAGIWYCSNNTQEKQENRYQVGVSGICFNGKQAVENISELFDDPGCCAERLYHDSMAMQLFVESAIGFAEGTSYKTLLKEQALLNLQPVYINHDWDEYLAGHLISARPAEEKKPEESPDAVAYRKDDVNLIPTEHVFRYIDSYEDESGCQYRKYGFLFGDSYRYILCAGYGAHTEQIWLLHAKVGNTVLGGNGDEIYRLAYISALNGGISFHCEENTMLTVGPMALASTKEEFTSNFYYDYPYTANPNNFLYWDKDRNSILSADEWRTEIHYSERYLLNNDAGLPSNAADAEAEGFKLLPESDAAFHQLYPNVDMFDYLGSLKYCHEDGREAIYQVIVEGGNENNVIRRSPSATRLLPLADYPVVGPTYNYSPNDFYEMTETMTEKAPGILSLTQLTESLRKNTVENMQAKLTDATLAHFYFDMIPYYWWGNGGF